MNINLSQLQEYLPLLIPIIIAQVVLLIVTLRHIFTHNNYKRGNRTLWVIIAIVGWEFWGAILYFLLGKED